MDRSPTYNYEGQLVNGSNSQTHTFATADLFQRAEQAVSYRGCNSDLEKHYLHHAILIARSKIPPAQDRKLTLDNLEIEHLMGAGSFGDLWKVKTTKIWERLL